MWRTVKGEAETKLNVCRYQEQTAVLCYAFRFFFAVVCNGMHRSQDMFSVIDSGDKNNRLNGW